MNENWIETFLSLVETKNISDTATRLYLAQSTVTNRLLSLEDYLGFDLFLRGKGKKEMMLTIPGANFLPLALELKNLFNLSSRMQFEEYGFLIRLSVPNSVIDTFLSHFTNFLENQMDIKFHLNISTEHSDYIYEEIYKNKLDIGIVTKELKYENVEVKKLLDVPLYLIQANDKRVSLSQPAGELVYKEHICIPWGVNVDQWITKNFPNRGMPLLRTDSALFSFPLLKDQRWFFAPKTYFDVVPEYINFSYAYGEDFPTYQLYVISNSATFKRQDGNYYRHFIKLLESYCNFYHLEEKYT